MTSKPIHTKNSINGEFCVRKCWKILKFNKRWGLNNSLAAIFFSNLINGEFFCTIIRGIWVEQLPIINKRCHLLLETWEYLTYKVGSHFLLTGWVKKLSQNVVVILYYWKWKMTLVNKKKFLIATLMSLIKGDTIYL